VPHNFNAANKNVSIKQNKKRGNRGRGQR